MRRWLAIAALLPVVASAGWRQLGTVTGTPADIVVVDAGVVVTSSSGANGEATVWFAQPDGGVTQLATLSGAAGYVGAGWDGTCLSALAPSSSLEFSAGCGSAVTIGVNSAGAYRSVGDRGVAITFAGAVAQFVSAPDVNTTWSAQSPSFTQSAAARSLGVVTIDGIDYAVAASNGIPGARVSIDGGAPFPITGVASSIDAVPFSLDGAPAALMVTNVGSLELVPDVRSTAVEPASIPSGLTLRRVAMAQSAGLSSTAAGVALSPIPDPARLARTWVPRTSGPALDGRVHCLDARWCAALLSTGAVWLYENEHAPEFTVSHAPIVPGAPTRFAVDAGDDDGDPVFVTWSLPVTRDGGSPNDSEVDITFPVGTCTANLDVSVRDALFSTTQQLTVSSEAHGDVVLTGPSTSLAGGPPVSFTADVDGGCVSATFSWSTSDGASGVGPQFAWTPPETSCTPGADVTITATASWSAGTPTSTQVTRVVAVEPWGAPNVPTFAPSATQDAGTSVVWSPVDVEHVCSAAGGFPGTQLVWDVIEAGGTTLEFVDGGVRIDAPASCDATRVVANARRVVVGEQHGRVSDAGTLTVDVLASREPLNASTPFSLTVDAGAGVVAGSTNVVASCLDSRELAARIAVLQGAAELTFGTFTSPGGWSLPIPGGCEGGTYEVVAQLLEDGGVTGAEARQVVTTTPAPVEIGELDVTEITAVCGNSVGATVTLQPVAGSCASADVAWRALSGPMLTTSSGTGDVVPLQLASTGLGDVGQQLELEFTVSGGASNVATATRSVRVVSSPFVNVSVASQPVLAQQEEGRTMVVTLANSTSCAVDGLVVEVTGRRIDSGSVRLDGAPVDVIPFDGGFRVEGVSLPADGSVQLIARQGPLLTSGATVVVSLNGYAVSMPLGGALRECGCSGAGGFALVWLVLATLLRRRR